MHEKDDVHQPVASCCSVMGEPGDAAVEESESSHEGSSVGVGLDIHIEVQPGKASLPLPTS